MKILIACAALLLLCLFPGGCTEYERSGVNPRPFNEPKGWETNPYGNDLFQN